MSDKPIIVDGIKVNVCEEDFDNIEVLEFIEDGKFVSAIKLIFGEEKYQEIKDKLRDPETGKTKTTAVNEWFEKVSKKVGAKN